MFVVGVLGAGLIYATSAMGTGQAGPSRAEFNALKKQVAALKITQTAHEKRIGDMEALVGLCFVRGVPIGRYGGFINQRPDGTVTRANALDIVDAFSGGVVQMYALDVGQNCAAVLAATPPFQAQAFGH
jgi:prolipoprotein diacylglyceryltransferase